MSMGLLEGQDVTGLGVSVHQYRPRCLTYKGHDFLEHARNETRWLTASWECFGDVAGLVLAVRASKVHGPGLFGPVEEGLK